MERLAYSELLKWKNKPNRKPLIVKGARQIGKTWLLQHFGKNEFEYVAYIRCDNEPIAKALFDDYQVTRIIRLIEAMTNVPVIAGKTLIILDEIQEIPKGLHALKYFCEEAPEYHIAVAGSLLGILLHPGESFPVGKVDMLQMYPMNFIEFLWAIGERSLADLLIQQDWDLISSLHSRYIEFLRQYYYVGGMPGVVMMYINHALLTDVRSEQLQILEAYRLDISKHANERETLRIQQVFQSIPAHLAKENKKFIYGVLRKGARASEYEIAIQWLVDAGIVHKVTRTNNGYPPLSSYEESSVFKLYLLDCGLFGAMCETEAIDVLSGDNIFKEYKGAFTELYVLEQLLIASSNKIYYYSTDNSQVEIDFIMQNRGKILPIEVKAEVNLRSKSLRQFTQTFGIEKSIRFSMQPFCNQNWLTNIPLYAVQCFACED